MHIALFGIGLGKTTFHLVALGERNKVLLRRKSHAHNCRPTTCRRRVQRCVGKPAYSAERHHDGL